jgi:hypothetical protein
LLQFLLGPGNRDRGNHRRGQRSGLTNVAMPSIDQRRCPICSGQFLAVAYSVFDDRRQADGIGGVRSIEFGFRESNLKQDIVRLHFVGFAQRPQRFIIASLPMEILLRQTVTSDNGTKFRHPALRSLAIESANNGRL